MAGTDRRETIRARRQRLSVLPPACEGCKIRKIRCDRSNPCSNCETSGITCEKAGPSARPGRPPRSDRETNLLDHVQCLEERVRLLERELTASSRTSEPPSATPNHDVIPADNESNILKPIGASSLFEGYSSFSNQSIIASEMAERAATSEGTREHSGLKSSLSHLSVLLQSPSKLLSSGEYCFSRNADGRALQNLEPLPLDLVIAMLQEMKKNRPIFLCSWAVNDYSLVERYCHRVYFPIEPTSLGLLAGMYGVLYMLLKEFMILRNPLSQKYDLSTHADKCAKNFHASLETYEVLAVPSFENVFALTMGYTKAQDEARPLLCCTLISAAINQCKMLGYHREISYRNNPEGNTENMRRLFWTAYVFEKHTSLLFGRASNIRDLDIDAEYPSLSAQASVRAWDESFIMGIKLARIQGQIYDRVYSAVATKIPTSERMQYVHELSTAMEGWYTELQKIDSSQVNNRQVFQLSRYSWDVTYYSTFTTLLRAPVASGPEGTKISAQCFQVARLSLQSHLRCFSNYRATEFLSAVEYANWVLLFSSFTPFLVIFLHAIAATSADDLQLLEDVVESLKHIAGVSRSSERLYKICSTFAKIARAFIEARRSNSVGTYNQQDDSLYFMNNPSQGPIIEPDDFRNFLVEDMADDDTFLAGQDMSAILDCWATGLSPGMSMFGGGFGGT